MRGIVAHTLVAERSAIQILQDAALSDRNRFRALMAQLDQLLLEALQCSHTHPDQVNMVIQQLVDAMACSAGLAAKFQQNPDIGQAHLQGPAMPNELQALMVFRLILTIPGVAAARRRGKLIAGRLMHS
jgi:hypothetical protein